MDKPVSIYKMVGSGAVTQANMRISAVNGTAFIDFSDSEAAANKLINHKGYLLKVRDSSKRAIQGFVKAAGTGETLDSEVIGNPDFTTVSKASAKTVVGITKANPGVVTFAAGHGYTSGDVIYFSGLTEMTELNTQYWQLRENSGDTFQLATVYNTTSLNTSAYGSAETTGGNCAQKVTLTYWTLASNNYVGVDGAGALTNKIVFITGLSGAYSNSNNYNLLGLYKKVCDYAVTSGSIRQRFGGINGSVVVSTSTVNDYITVTETLTNVQHNPITAFTGTVDNSSNKQVLTPSATGVTITSTKGGSTFNFAALGSAFNYNDASGYTYELWQVNNAVEVASGSIAAGEMLADTTSDNAFVAPVGVDLSAYQTGKYIFAAYNTVGGYAAFGYIKGTAPGGETLDSELIGAWTNSPAHPFETFTTDGANITQAINSTVHGLCYRDGTALPSGSLYKLVTTITLNSGTLPLFMTGNDVTIGNTSFTVAAGSNTVYRTIAISPPGQRYFGFKIIAATTDFAAASNSFKQVLTPAATGALIVSAKDGATRAWAYKHASFNPNIASTFKIFFVGD